MHVIVGNKYSLDGSLVTYGVSKINIRLFSFALTWYEFYWLYIYHIGSLTNHVTMNSVLDESWNGLWKEYTSFFVLWHNNIKKKITLILIPYHLI